MRILLAAVHGILNPEVELTWVDKLDAFLWQKDPGIKVLKKEYEAGATPRYNTWFKDPKLARSLVNEIIAFIEQAIAAGQSIPEIWLVCHSNGVIIGLLAAKDLVARGYDIAGIIMIGGAAQSDVQKNGVLKMIGDGTEPANLMKAIAFANRGDDTVPHAPDVEETGAWNWVKHWSWKLLAWPYGGMGHEGWTLKGKPYATDKVYTNWYSPTYGHSGYWTNAHIAGTFEDIHRLVTAP